MGKKPIDESIPGPHLTTGDIARYCHFTVSQVNRWIKKGDLKAFRNVGGHYRVMKSDFRKFLEQNGMPVIEKYFEEGKKKKILVADDDTDLANGIGEILKNHYKDFQVEVAFDGYAVLITVGNLNPDLLILDIRMPKIDGLDVCKRIRENKAISSQLKILAITGHSEAYDRNKVLAAGANEYLLKPIDKDILLQYVEKLL